MSSLPKPPKQYDAFVGQFPLLGAAWESINKAGSDGPLDDRTMRLVKLGVAMGAMREGSVHASVRKALAIGITPEEVHQVVALAAGTLGMPSCVAVHSWAQDIISKQT